MKPWRVLVGDARQRLLEIPDASAQVCVTSPPYFGLRSYLDDDDPDKPHEIGQEQTPESYIEGLLAVFAQVYRILRPDGTLWLNLGDSYAGSGPNRQTGLDAMGKSREVRIQLGRRFIGTELKAEYAAMAMRRIREMEEQIAGMLFNPQGGTLG